MVEKAKTEGKSKDRDWYGDNGSGNAAGANQQAADAAATESTPQRQARERTEAFGRHTEARTSLNKLQEKEWTDLMERHAGEIDAGAQPSGAVDTPAAKPRPAGAEA